MVAQNDEAPAAPAPAEPTIAERCESLREGATADAEAIVTVLKTIGPFDNSTRSLALLERELANSGEMLRFARQRLEALL